MYAEPFLLSCESASALRPLYMLSRTCPACTCAKARFAQHKASDARFVRGWVGGAPIAKEGSESSCEAACSVPKSAYSVRDPSRACRASWKSPIRIWIHPSKERLLASSSWLLLARASSSACCPCDKACFVSTHTRDVIWARFHSVSTSAR